MVHRNIVQSIAKTVFFRDVNMLCLDLFLSLNAFRFKVNIFISLFRLILVLYFCLSEKGKIKLAINPYLNMFFTKEIPR